MGFFFTVSWALHLSLFILFHISHSNCLLAEMHKWQIKISWFLIYDLHCSHNTPVCGPLDQDQLSNSFLVTPTPTPTRRLVSLTAALCCLLSDYGNVILTLGNAIVRQTVKIDNLRFARTHQRGDARRADTQMELFAAFSHVKCQAD